VLRHGLRLSCLVAAVVAVLGLLPAGAWAKPAKRNPKAVASVSVKKSKAKPARRGRGKTKTKTKSKGAVKKAPRYAAVSLYHVNHRERLNLRPRDSKGRPVKGMQKRFEHLLRCHYTNKQHRIHPRLMAVVYEIGRHWPGHRLEVISGYRHPKYAKNPKSPHKQGRACDLRVAGVSNAELRDWVRGHFKKVGVGYYPNSSFVHVDVRDRASAFWIDYSGPGENAVYAKNARQDLVTGRVDKYKPGRDDLLEMGADEPAGASEHADEAEPAVIKP